MKTEKQLLLLVFLLGVAAPALFGNEGMATLSPAGAPINAGHENSQPSVTTEGSIYFSLNVEGGQEGFDIFRSRFANGRYLPVENLGPAVNTEKTEIHPFVDPDERYLIFSSDRSAETGGFDLYISFSAVGGG